MRCILVFAITVVTCVLPATSRALDWADTLGASNDDCSHRLTGSVDYLYWKARRNGMDFAISDPDTDDNIEGTMEALELESTGGVRASLGFWAACDWDLTLTYTHFDSDDHLSLDAIPGGQLWMTRSNPASFNNDAAAATADATLDYDLLDLGAGYWIRPSEMISIRVFGGPRGVWTRQEMNIEYSGGTVAGSRTQTQRTEMNGFGLRAGSQVHWHLGKALSLFGSVRCPPSPETSVWNTARANRRPIRATSPCDRTTLTPCPVWRSQRELILAFAGSRCRQVTS